MTDIGRALILLGLGIVALGALVSLAGRIPFLGHLPGDISIRGAGGGFYVPVVTCLVLSLALTVALNLVGIFLRH